jgi:hypothetical protein
MRLFYYLVPVLIKFMSNHVGQGSWGNPTSVIFFGHSKPKKIKEILAVWTVGRPPSSPPFDFYSTIDLLRSLIYWTPNTDYPSDNLYHSRLHLHFYGRDFTVFTQYWKVSTKFNSNCSIKIKDDFQICDPPAQNQSHEKVIFWFYVIVCCKSFPPMYSILHV